MDAILIFLTSIGTAYLVARTNRRGAFGLADLVIGIFCGIVSLILSRLLGTEGVAWEPGLPLFLAFALPLGLVSTQHRSVLR